MNNLQDKAQKELKRLIERVERIEDERKELGKEVAEILQDAKATGFDPKIIRKVLAIRKKTKADYLEEEAILASYLQAVSWLDTPLGKQAESDPEPEPVPEEEAQEAPRKRREPAMAGARDLDL